MLKFAREFGKSSPPAAPILGVDRRLATRAERDHMTSSTIPVVVALPATPSDSKSILGRAGAIVHAAVDVDAEKLKENLSGLVKKIATVIAVTEATSGGLVLKEVEVGIEITAEGGVALIGTLGATASMTLTFERKA
jgi:hypothetical protein